MREWEEEKSVKHCDLDKPLKYPLELLESGFQEFQRWRQGLDGVD